MCDDIYDWIYIQVDGIMKIGMASSFLRGINPLMLHALLGVTPRI